MDATSQASAIASTPRRRGLPLAQILVGTAIVALVAVVAASALRFLSATTFHKERAFRVLNEVAGQLDNLQGTLANQLRLMPDSVRNDQTATYARRLALEGPKVELTEMAPAARSAACAHARPDQSAFLLRADGAKMSFEAFSCFSGKARENASGSYSIVRFYGSLTDTVEGFASQSFFDEVLVALEDGSVIATLPKRLEARSSEIQLHAARDERLGLTSVAAMLQRAHGPAKENDKEGASDAGRHEPFIFRDVLAGDAYQVFGEVIHSRHPILFDRSDGLPAKRQDRLYLIGLKRHDVRADIAAALGPVGRFLLIVLVLLAVLFWPIASVRSKTPEDPIAWTEALACLASIVLIPATVAITAVWAWSYQGLRAWADRGALTYAEAVSLALTNELQRDIGLLSEYRELYEPAREPGLAPLQGEGASPPGGEPKTLVAAVEDEGSAGATPRSVAGILSYCQCRDANETQTCIFPGNSIAGNEGAARWPFSSVFATDAGGRRVGERYATHGVSLLSPGADLSGREYFQVLQSKQGWALPDSPVQRGAASSFAAQRIFSGGDGARVLQLAVPRCAAGDCKEFGGIITGNVRAYGLSAAVSVPLLKFAVVDQSTGMVLFHSDDTRSLSENFFVETEQNSQLRALTAVHQHKTFSGYYMGSPHRFYHAPMADVPWSVVAFYSLNELGELPWHAALTALASYAGVALVLLILSGVVLWLCARRDAQGARKIMARFWHRVGCSCSYAWWGVGLFGAAVAIVTIYEGVDPAPISPLTGLMWIVLLIAGVAVWQLHRRASHRVCIPVWLLLISSVPAAWLALGYFDAQVRGLLRDGLVTASKSVERHEMIIADNLRRWRCNEAEQRAFSAACAPGPMRPDVSVPGYSKRQGSAPVCTADGWILNIFAQPPLNNLITHRPLDFWRRETWRAAATDEVQQRRIQLLADDSTSNHACAAGEDGLTAPWVHRAADGRIIVASAGVHSSTEPREATSAEAQGRPRANGVNAFDSAWRLVWNVVAAIAALGIPWMLAQFVSRRVLGERAKPSAAAPSADAPAHGGLVLYTQAVEEGTIDRLLQTEGADPNERDRSAAVSLAAHASLSDLAAHRPADRPLVLRDLDLALTDAPRRVEILAALERLTDDPAVKLAVICRRSPIERLYHPERFPESGSEHFLSVHEAGRWDTLLQKFNCRHVPAIPRSTARTHLRAVDHHKAWKHCNRAERLLLYHVASGRLANPRNEAVIDALVARGLLKLNPWPAISDPGFEAFVRTAEDSRDMAEWHKQASRAPGKRARTVLATLLITLMIVVIWFSWSAGEQLKLVSAVVGAAVAFLGQIGNAFSFMRSNIGGGSSGGRS